MIRIVLAALLALSLTSFGPVTAGAVEPHAAAASPLRLAAASVPDLAPLAALGLMKAQPVQYACRRDCRFCRQDCYGRFRIDCYGPYCRDSFTACMRECWEQVCRGC